MHPPNENLDSALLRLLRAATEARWQELVDEIRDQTCAFGVEFRSAGGRPIARAGAIKEHAPILVESGCDPTSCGKIAIWTHDDSLPEQVQVRLEIVAGVAATVLERNALRNDNRQFIHTLAHDLRGALVRSHHLAELLARPLPESEERCQFQRDLIDNLARGESLLRHAAILATPCDEREPISEVTVTSLMQNVCWNLKHELLQNSVELTTQNTDTPVWVREAAFTDALQRIVDNSAKYGASRILVTADEVDGGTLIRLLDNGPGIEPAYAEEVFQPLKRLHGNNIPGHGLGLSIARKIVQEHGGSLSLDPLVDSGVAMNLWLPKRKVK